MTEESTPESPNTLKKIGLVGVGAAATAGLIMGAAGLAGAQEDDPTLEDPAPTEESDDTESDSSEDRRAAHEARHQAMIDELVEDGAITQDQVDDWQAVRDAIQAQRDARRLERLEGIADVLDTTVEDLQAAREDGQSLAEIAGDNLDELVAHLTEEATTKINEAVADGLMTQEQADERLDGLAERIESRIENGGGFGGRGHRHGPRHRHGSGGPAAADDTGAEVATSFA